MTMIGFSRTQAVALVAMIALIIVAPGVLYPVFLMKVLCFGLFACAFNLLIGYVGLLSFGHAAYFGMGSYIAAWTAKTWGVSAEVAILAGGVSAAVLGTAFGWLAIRRQGIYFAMITLALSQMIYFSACRAAVHRRRGRHPAGAARAAARDHPDGQRHGAVLARRRHLPGGLPADPPDRALAIRRGADRYPRE